ncbi:hypothetical protein [Vibrio superstes]|uniref:TetR family transcriptional regulator n=1 Tax=Vibrio superstes NBRC 103154 TaxID=1219062 RepID=A0A511QP86_9VIBR|nr:hypothetical protein [Vibrio superstes]GEM79151.1 hypothetical protein VSU01S_13960 [Vibrio superstes NBRC 103154]
MARISREQYEANKKMLDDYIWETFKAEGWDAVTYSRLAQFMNTRKSTIQGYYPNCLNFLEGIEGRAFPEMLPLLDMTSPDTFLESWCDTLTVPLFRNYYELFALDAIQGLTGTYSKRVSLKLKGRLSAAFELNEEDTEKLFRMAMGSALAVLANR